MAFFLTEEEAQGFVTIDAIADWVGLNVLVIRNRKTDWSLRKHAPQSGNAPTSQFREAVKVAKITETDGQERLLAPVEAAQIGLVWRSTPRKLSGNLASWVVIDPFEVPSDQGATTQSVSGGGAFVCGKEIEDGTHPRPRRRIRVHTRRCWTHYRLVSQLRRDHARTTRRRGNADKRAIIGIERESDRPTGFPSRRFRRFHTLRAENNQSSSFHRLPPSAGRLLVGERNPWSNQLSNLALLLGSFPCGVFNVEGSARDASGPLPAENREAGNSVANSLAPCLFGRRQVQVRAFQSLKSRIEFDTSLGRAAPSMWDAGSLWSAIFLKAAEGDETYWDENIRHAGAPKAREQLVAEAALAGGMAALVPEMSAPQGAVIRPRPWYAGSRGRGLRRPQPT